MADTDGWGLIARNVEQVRERVAAAARRAGRDPDGVTVVAVAKTRPAEAVLAAVKAGVRHVGENRVQEAAAKIPAVRALGPRPTWHLIGHLQTNKAKAAAELFDWIQSVDSTRVAVALDQFATRRLPVLLEVNVAAEPTKSGFRLAEGGPPGPGQELLEAALPAILGLPNLEVRGLMTIAPLVEDPEAVRPVFRRLRQLADALGLPEVSMGMTDDFEVAIEEGATVVRIGRAIFGERTA